MKMVTRPSPLRTNAKRKIGWSARCGDRPPLRPSPWPAVAKGLPPPSGVARSSSHPSRTRPVKSRPVRVVASVPPATLLAAPLVQPVAGDVEVVERYPRRAGLHSVHPLCVPVDQGLEEGNDQSAFVVVDHLHLVTERNPVRLVNLADGLVKQRGVVRIVEVGLVFGPRPRNRRQARL